VQGHILSTSRDALSTSRDALSTSRDALKNVKNQVLTSVRWAFDFSYRLPVSGNSKTSKELPGFMKEPTKTQQF
jgi:hypothetical protein